MKFFRKIAAFLLLIPIYFYRGFISPLIGPACRHSPSCSQYSIDAIRNTGPLRGLILGTNRILRCRPGGTHGYDPAPIIWVKRYKAGSAWSGKWKRSNRLKERDEL